MIMSALKIGTTLASLRLPLPKALVAAGELGAGGVQIDARGELRPGELSGTGLRHLRRRLDDLNLKVSAITFPTRRGYENLDDLDRRVEATKAAMRFARELGANVLVNDVGQIPEPLEGPTWQTLAEVLLDLGRFGQRTGVMLAARTGRANGPALASLIAALPEGTLGVHFDPARLVLGGHPVAEAAASLGPHIIHVAVNDAVYDLGQGRGVEVQLGRGTVDFPALLGLLEEHAYRGWFTVDRSEAVDPLLEVGQTIEFMRQMSP